MFLGRVRTRTRGYIIGLVKSVALELGQHRITVNAIEPGLIDTPMTRNARRGSEAVR